jgi:hypothetical protein
MFKNSLHPVPQKKKKDEERKEKEKKLLFNLVICHFTENSYSAFFFLFENLHQTLSHQVISFISEFQRQKILFLTFAFSHVPELLLFKITRRLLKQKNYAYLHGSLCAYQTFMAIENFSISREQVK